MFIDVRSDVCVSHMCVGMHVNRCVDLSEDMCIDQCADVHAAVCVDNIDTRKHRHTLRNVHRHVRKSACRPLTVSTENSGASPSPLPLPGLAPAVTGALPGLAPAVGADERSPFAGPSSVAPLPALSLACASSTGESIRALRCHTCLYTSQCACLSTHPYVFPYTRPYTCPYACLAQPPPRCRLLVGILAAQVPLTFVGRQLGPLGSGHAHKPQNIHTWVDVP